MTFLLLLLLFLLMKYIAMNTTTNLVLFLLHWLCSYVPQFFLHCSHRLLLIRCSYKQLAAQLSQKHENMIHDISST